MAKGEGTVIQLTKEFKQLGTELRQLRKRWKGARQRLLLAATKHMNPRPKKFHTGVWYCNKSPTGFCVVDAGAVSYSSRGDRCLFCGGVGN
jgi:hypothetical protein